jgi:hypothetical protein
MLKSNNPRDPQQICHYSGVMRLSSIGGPLLSSPGAARTLFGDGLAG